MHVKSESLGTPVSWPASMLGEGESEKYQVLLQYLGWDVYTSMSRFEKDVLYDCMLSKPMIVIMLLMPV